MSVHVASWNLFHGRSLPATHADLRAAFVEALGAAAWDICGLQEAPPWWAQPLGRELGASVRGVHTSLLRGVLPRAQAAIHGRDPERIGVRGAAANLLLVRPAAGVIVAHRGAVLRRAPQRRTVHAVRLRRPSGEHWWVANVHTHNRPESAAAADLIRALRVASAWAGDEPLVLLGDLNLTHPHGLARVEGFAPLFGHRVDHVLGRGVQAGGDPFAALVQQAGVTLSDHRLIGVRVARPGDVAA